MARSKHTVALFEVIHRDKRFKGTASPKSAFSTPAWWFKRRVAKPKPIENPPPAAKTTVDRSPRRTGPTLVERGRQFWQILSKNLAAQTRRINGPIVGVAVALVVCGGVLLARSLRSTPHIANTAFGNTDLLRQGPAHPEVTKVYDNSAEHRRGEILDYHTGQIPIDAQAAGNTLAAAPARQINLQYVIVQSYADKAAANEAREFLAKSGVACTIEQGIANWRKDFYQVVGLDGFTRASGPDYTAYRKRIESLDAQFTSLPHNHKGFLPMAVKWEKTN